MPVVFTKCDFPPLVVKNSSVKVRFTLSMYPVKFNSFFVLPAESLRKVFVFDEKNQAKLIPRTYTVGLFEEFSKFVLGKYSVVQKEDRWGSFIIRFKCNDGNCLKAFKITCKKNQVMLNKDLNWTVESDSKVCQHEGQTPRNSNFKGYKREAVKNQLRFNSVNKVYKEMISSDDITKVTKGVTGKHKDIKFKYLINFKTYFRSRKQKCFIWHEKGDPRRKRPR